MARTQAGSAPSRPSPFQGSAWGRTALVLTDCVPLSGDAAGSWQNPVLWEGGLRLFLQVSGESVCCEPFGQYGLLLLGLYSC